MPLRTALLSLLIAFALISSACAQSIDAENLTISILTFGPGEAVYERFGHNAIRVRDASRDIDACFEWGNFAFTPGFLFTFAKGDLRYWMSGDRDGTRMIDFYGTQQDRLVIEQTLNLSTAQKRALVQRLIAEDTPANRFYQYDYFKDNCSTRVRDAIDQASGGALRAATRGQTDHSYRWHMRRLMAVGPTNTLLATLCDMLGGPRIDVPISAWQTGFIPTELAAQLDSVQIEAADGSRVPLVSDRRVLHVPTSDANAEPTQSPNPLWRTLPTAIFWGGAILLLARRWQAGFRILAGAWELFVLFASLLMPWMIGFSAHWPIAWNENLFQFTPLSVVVLMAIWRGRWRGRLGWAAFGAVVLSAVGALVTISHLTPQRNAPAVALALPMHFAVWAGLIRSSRTATRDVADTDESKLERTPA